MDKMTARELLICQRVCRKFRDIFQRSTEFKQRLHLVPKLGDHERELAPVLPQIFAEASIQRQGTGTRIDFREDLRYGSVFGASWREMQLASPPVTEVMIELVIGSFTRSERWSLVYEDGVTMGAVFLALLRHQTWKRGEHLAISF